MTGPLFAAVDAYLGDPNPFLRGFTRREWRAYIAGKMHCPYAIREPARKDAMDEPYKEHERLWGNVELHLRPLCTRFIGPCSMCARLGLCGKREERRLDICRFLLLAAYLEGAAE